MEKDTIYFTYMQHDMPQSLYVFAVSSTPETLNFGTFGGVPHPLEEFFNFCYLAVYICTCLKFKW